MDTAHLSASEGSRYEYTPFPNLVDSCVSTVRFWRLAIGSTNRPVLVLAPNSRVVNALLMIAQIPHESQLQNRAPFVPKSQIHWVVWKVSICRGCPSPETLELGKWTGQPEMIVARVGGTRIVQVSFTGFDDVAGKADLVDFCYMDLLRTLPQKVKVVGDCNMVSNSHLDG